jgi:ABC-type branched-subunit amino acid transport system permease subunit
VEALLAGILGGINSLLGAVVGTAILKTLDVVLSGITERYMLIMGVLFMLVIMFARQGIVGTLMTYWNNRLFPSRNGSGSGAAARRPLKEA